MLSTDSTVYAEYKQESPSKLPFLTERKITPQMLYRFEKGCQRYFVAKGVSQDADQVLRTMAGLCDPIISMWVHSHRSQLITLSFKDFMKKLRKRALDTDYEIDIKREMTRSTYSLTIDFQNWADNIIFLNCILQDTDKHFDDTRLLELLQVNLDTDLDRRVRDQASRVRTDSVKNWVEDVRRLVEAERRNIKRLRGLAEEAHKPVKRQARRTAKTTSPTRRHAKH